MSYLKEFACLLVLFFFSNVRCMPFVFCFVDSECVFVIDKTYLKSHLTGDN